MTVKLASWQLIVVGLVIGGLTAAVIVLAVSGGGNSKPAAQAALSPTEVPRQADVAPTTPPPTSTVVPPTPVPPPPPPPTEIPVRTDCAAIKATGYQSDAERNYFLANCTGGNSPAPTARPGGAAPPPPAPPPAPAAVGLTAEEQHYKDQASAQLAYLNAQVAQFSNGNFASFGTGSAAILQLCTLVGNVVPALDNLQPVPPRYKAVHDAMRGTHVKLHDDCVTFNSGMTAAQITAWFNKLVVDINAANGAIDDYSRVVGIKLQDLSN